MKRGGDSLEATIELLADETAVKRIHDADADIAAGRGTTAEEMDELMKRCRQRERRDT